MRFTAALAAIAGLATARHGETALVGANIGGWMVLEPWVTPSLFYRFLGKHHEDGIGADMWTFCEALGPEEGNKVLRAHWDAWITEEHLQDLKDKGVEVIRVPVGDWTLESYGPYTGCTDGAVDKIDWILETAGKVGLKVWVDLHAIEGSQNGYDNSGVSNKTVWTDEDHFDHWDTQSANWLGDWDTEKMEYVNHDYSKLAKTIKKVEALIAHFSTKEAFWGFEPVNEPLFGTGLDILHVYYRKVRELLRSHKPDAQFIFHDSYHTTGRAWNDLFADDDMENVIYDFHPYIAFGAKFESDIMTHCDQYKVNLELTKDVKYPIFAGEWSLATDTCAHWLNGFNDHRDEYAYSCALVECPKPYLDTDLAPDFDRDAYVLGPFGSGTDLGAIHQGKCYSDSDYFSDQQVMQLSKCMMDLFAEFVDGQFIWASKVEIESRWSFVEAYEKGWLDPSVSFFSSYNPRLFLQ